MSSSPQPDTHAPERTSSISALVDEPRPEDLPSADDVESPVRAPRRRVRERFADVRARLVPWSAWTLRAKLVASMLALFTVLSLATGAVTVLTLNNQLTSQVDDQLNQSIMRNLSGGPLPDFSVTEDNERRSGGPGDEGLIAFLPTQSTPLFPAPVGAATSLDKDRRNLTAAQLSILANAGLGRDATDVQLGGSQGSYRVVAAYTTLTPRGLPATQGTPGVLIVGLPTTPNEHTVQRMAVLAISTVAAGIVLVFVLGSWIVRRNLEPLQRVADTATRVSRMPLSSGKVALAERVDPADTDTRTEVGQVGAALNEMLDHVDEALNSRHQSEQRVRQFVADASHELRTPLASIKGYAELSRREPEEVPTSVTHAMGRIESEANRMSSLVEDLLLLARLDAGRPLEQKPVDLSMIVINAVSDAHAASPDHVWDLDLPPEPIEVTGDTARLHQVAANLLANARTHTPAGTRVTTSIRQDGGWVRLAVQDNGPGVPAALQPNVFERFARGDDARNRVGGSTGLGLSIVAAVAKALGGRVELQSRPGDTTFSVFLPAAPVPA
jgi:two-component system OmpR family sensor kinase